MQDVQDSQLDVFCLLLQNACCGMVDAMFMAEECHKTLIELSGALGREICSVARQGPRQTTRSRLLSIDSIVLVLPSIIVSSASTYYVHKI